MDNCYYDKWSDRNREAFKQGEKDAFWDYRSHRHDYDSYSERGCAYNSGYEEERRRIEQRAEEERQDQERMERIRAERQREEERLRYLEEEEYYRQQREEEYQDYLESDPRLDGETI